MTTTVKTKKTVEEEIQVELPAFFTVADTFYKIEDKKEFIVVDNSRVNKTIQLYNGIEFPHSVLTWKKTNEAAFNNAFQNALSHICKKDAETSLPKASPSDIAEKIFENNSTCESCRISEPVEQLAPADDLPF